MKNEKLRIIDLGLIEYQRAYKIQKAVLEDRKNNNISDTLIIAEHLPVITIGRTGSRENLLVDEEILKEKDIALFEVDRGGDIAFHGPGQVVLYPIIDLRKRSLDLHNYIRNLEELVIRFLGEYNIEGYRIKGLSGVWAKDKKIAFVGIGASGWISFHGVSININTDLGYFSMIRSCGIKGIEITSLAKILNETADLERSKKALVAAFDSVFEQKEEFAWQK